jgi:hypothetical protein
MMNVKRLLTDLADELKKDTGATEISNVLVETPDGLLHDLLATFNVYGPSLHGRTAGAAIVLKMKE